MNLSEVQLELRIQKPNFRSLEYFSNKIATLLQHFYSDIQCSHQKLGLDVLIHIVKSCYVRCPIANHQITQLALESLKNFRQCLPFGYVAHYMVHVVNWSGFLQIDRNYPFPLFGLPLDLEQPLLAQFLPADLAPATRGSAEVDNSMRGIKDVVDVVDLKQLVC